MDLSYERTPFGKAQQFKEMLSAQCPMREVDFVSFRDGFLERRIDSLLSKQMKCSN